jgi:glycosyltransferase involved in cell wall biosynthesis
MTGCWWVLALIERYGLDQRVVLTGLLQAEEVTAAYQDADLFVLPCRTDTFPMTIIEACRQGLPMVITEGCEIAYLVKDRVADVVPFDKAAIAAAMQSLLTERDKYERYRANCPLLMRQSFSLSTTVDRLEELYVKVIADSRGNE